MIRVLIVDDDDLMRAGTRDEGGFEVHATLPLP